MPPFPRAPRPRASLLLPTAALIATAGLLASCGHGGQQAAPPPPEVGVVTLKSEPVTLSAELPGRIAAVETSEVRPQVGGIIVSRSFEQGSLVHKGQLLYKIEDAPYRAALGTALGNLATAQASIRSTQLQAERYHRLLAIRGVSQQEADNADASAASARATVAARRADVAAARVNLGFTNIRAPITGRVGRSLITVGALAQPGQADPLATIQRMDRVYVDLTQAAGDLLDLHDKVRQGQVARGGPDSAQVELLLPNGKVYPQRGRLEFSEVTVDQASGSVTVRAAFDNPDGVLLPGMYVRARLVEGVQHQAILAPQQGVSHDERGRPTALVVGAGNKVEQRDLTVDRAIGDKWIVTGGLKAGDRLVVEGLLRLKPGQVVTPKAPEQVTAGQAGTGQAGTPAAGQAK